MIKNTLISCMRSLFRLAFRVRVSGQARTFQNPRTLIVANHESLLDGVLLALFLPVRATFVVHTEVAAKWYFRLFLKLVPHLAMDSTSPMATRVICRLVEQGIPVVIFPEGRLTVTGSLMKVYDGAGFIAARTGATVVPVRIQGSGQSFFGRLAGIYPRKFFPRMQLTVLPPRHIAMPVAASAKQRRRRAGELMRQVLLDMLVITRPQCTLFEAFLAARKTFGAHYRLVEDIRLKEESYGSLLKMSLGAQRMLDPHTDVGQNVGVLLPNAAPTLAVILALSASRRVPAMLNYTAGAASIDAACKAARIGVVVTSRTFIEKAKLAGTIAQLTGISVLYAEDLRAGLTAWDKIQVLARLISPRLAMVPQAPTDPAVVLFTSGSEGAPKGVVHSHNSILANVAQTRAVADFTPHDKFMIALPMFHSFGFTCGVVMPLVSGCKVFLYPTPLHYRIIPEIVYDRNCTVLFGTSTFLAHYGKQAHPYDFARLRYVVAGAEKLSEDVRQLWIDKFGVRILEGYGVTECAPVIAVNVPMACRRATVGQFLPGIEYALEPVDGVPEGGILHVKGPNIMLGYLKIERPGEIEPPHSRGAGWYSTGDIVDIDADGFVRIQGRVKRFAKIAGEMISLEVVEKLAAIAAPEALHAAVTRPDAAKGEAIVLFTTSPDLTREQLSAAARANGAPELAVPRQLLRLNAIPVLGTGKTDYMQLKRLAEIGANT